MLYIASDHAGFQLKKTIVTYITKVLKLELEDLGPFEYNKADDYPDFAEKLGKKVAKNKQNKGILLCGMGNGVAMAANKIAGIRAALAPSIKSAEFARKDEDANVVCMAGRTLSNEHARAIVKAFLETPADPDERHARRRKKLAALDA